MEADKGTFLVDGEGRRMTTRMSSVSSAFSICAFVGTGFFFMSAESWSHDELQDTLSVESDSYEVDFVGTVEADTETPGKHDLLIQILDKAKKNKRLVALDGSTMPPEEMSAKMEFAGKDRLLLRSQWIGKPNMNTRLYFIDPATGTLLDSFYCRKPVLSPGKRFVVYERGGFQYGCNRPKSDLVLIYDARVEPEANRLPTSAEPYGVGLPIYPAAFAAAGCYYSEDQREPERPLGLRHTISSPFLWSEDEKCFVFLSIHDGYTFLVRVDLTSGVRKARVSETKIIVTEEMAKPEKAEVLKYYLDRDDRCTRYIHADELAWDESSQVRIRRQSSDGDFLKAEILVALPE